MDHLGDGAARKADLGPLASTSQAGATTDLYAGASEGVIAMLTTVCFQLTTLNEEVRLVRSEHR